MARLPGGQALQPVLVKASARDPVVGPEWESGKACSGLCPHPLDRSSQTSIHRVSSAESRYLWTPEISIVVVEDPVGPPVPDIPTVHRSSHEGRRDVGLSRARSAPTYVPRMNTRSRTCGVPPFQGGRKCGENTDGVEETRYPIPKRLDDHFPLVGMPRAGEVADVLEQDHRRLPRLEDPGDVPEERPPRLIHPPLEAGLGKGWQGKPAASTSCSGTGPHQQRGVDPDIRVDTLRPRGPGSGRPSSSGTSRGPRRRSPTRRRTGRRHGQAWRGSPRFRRRGRHSGTQTSAWKSA